MKKTLLKSWNNNHTFDNTQQYFQQANQFYVARVGRNFWTKKYTFDAYLATHYSNVTMSILSSQTTGNPTVCLTICLNHLSRLMQEINPRCWLCVCVCVCVWGGGGGGGGGFTGDRWFPKR